MEKLIIASLILVEGTLMVLWQLTHVMMGILLDLLVIYTELADIILIFLGVGSLSIATANIFVFLLIIGTALVSGQNMISYNIIILL